jgi:hypothetical protein
MFTCELCEYNTTSKYNYNRHINRKIKCVQPKTTQISVHETQKETFTKLHDNKWKCTFCNVEIVKCSKRYHYEVSCKFGKHVLQCKFCDKVCKNRYEKYRHQKTCTHVVHVQSHSAITITTNNYVQNNYNIIINEFNKENVDRLVYMLGNVDSLLLQEPREVMLDMTKLTYFNADFPENQTVRKLDKKSKLIEVSMGNNKWDVRSADSTMIMIKKTLCNIILSIDKEEELIILKNIINDTKLDQQMLELIYTCSKLGGQLLNMEDLLKCRKGSVSESEKAKARRALLEKIIIKQRQYEDAMDVGDSKEDIEGYLERHFFSKWKLDFKAKYTETF